MKSRIDRLGRLGSGRNQREGPKLRSKPSQPRGLAFRQWRSKKDSLTAGESLITRGLKFMFAVVMIDVLIICLI